jgi:membrane protein
MQLQWRRHLRPFWQAYRLWLRADCVDLSAAFAYHTLQSFFPALLIVLSLVSRLLGRDPELLERLMALVSRILPVSALPSFESTLERFTRQGVGAGILGLILLILSSSNIYLTLQRGADRLWWNRPFDFDGLTWQQVVVRFVALRLKALFLLFVVGLLIVLDQLISSLRFLGSTVIRSWLLERIPAPWLGFGSVSNGVDVGVSLLISFVAALVFLWLLPSRRIPLRPLLPAALLVSLSTTILNLILGRSLVLLGLRFQAYGVVGGVLALTLWIWLVGVILYYAQCLSVVLDRRSLGGHSTLLRPRHLPAEGPG